MRSLAIVLFMTTIAAADRNADFSAEVVGAKDDVAAVTLVHGKKTWAMKVGDQTIETSEPAQHGDYVVFVAPGKRVAWIKIGDVEAMPKPDDIAVRTYGLDKKVTSVRFGDLFTANELATIERSSGGWRWIVAKPIVDKTMVTVPTGSTPVVVNASAGTASRKH